MKEVQLQSALFDTARRVYQWMEDDHSKALFERRFSWSGTESNLSIHDMVSLASPRTNELVEVKKEQLHKAKTIVLYGAGEVGEYVYQLYNLEQIGEQDEKKICFCDRQYQTKGKCCGQAVISPQVMVEEVIDPRVADYVILICAIPGYNAIKRFLVEHEVLESCIIPFCFEEQDGQYFDSLMEFHEDEVFVDVGSFDGVTSKLFTEKCKGFKKIHVFEPDKEKMRTVKKKLSFLHEHQVTFYEVGAWSKKETLRFSNDLGIDGMSSTIKEDGNIEIHCDKLDDVLKDELVTFIKMDIEGAELEALKGAEHLIRTHKPKLAISIYHKPEDILSIPLYLKSLVPEYKFYLRHYSNWSSETVLYAIESVSISCEMCEKLGGGAILS